jgi:hypothetical protein
MSRMGVAKLSSSAPGESYRRGHVHSCGSYKQATVDVETLSGGWFVIMTASTSLHSIIASIAFEIVSFKANRRLGFKESDSGPEWHSTARSLQLN